VGRGGEGEGRGRGWGGGWDGWGGAGGAGGTSERKRGRERGIEWRGGTRKATNMQALFCMAYFFCGRSRILRNGGERNPPNRPSEIKGKKEVWGRGKRKRKRRRREKNRKKGGAKFKAAGRV